MRIDRVLYRMDVV